jgi:hypothetical protein
MSRQGNAFWVFTAVLAFAATMLNLWLYRREGGNQARSNLLLRYRTGFIFGLVWVVISALRSVLRV